MVRSVSTVGCALVFAFCAACDASTDADAGASAVDAPVSDTRALDGASAVDMGVMTTLDAASMVTDVAVADELTSLPPDTGGTHTAHPLGSTGAAFGYYNYLPGGYDDTTAGYPLIVFLHGRGERG